MSYSVKLNEETGKAEKVEPSQTAGFSRDLTAGLEPPRRRIPKTLTKAGAIRLANIIARYWRERGATTVKMTVERDHSVEEIELWTVRSNLVGALPPKSV